MHTIASHDAPAATRPLRVGDDVLHPQPEQLTEANGDVLWQASYQVWGNSVQEVREAHFDHHLDNSVRHGGNTPAIWAKASGKNSI